MRFKKVEKEEKMIHKAEEKFIERKIVLVLKNHQALSIIICTIDYSEFICLYM